MRKVRHQRVTAAAMKSFDCGRRHALPAGAKQRFFCLLAARKKLVFQFFVRGRPVNPQVVFPFALAGDPDLSALHRALAKRTVQCCCHGDCSSRVSVWRPAMPNLVALAGVVGFSFSGEQGLDDLTAELAKLLESSGMEISQSVVIQTE